MMKLEVNTEDINKVLLKIAEIQRYTDKELDLEFARTASAISRRAKIDVPKRTGFLSTTINFGKDENVYVQAEAKYAGFVEHGWRSKKGRKVGPFKYFYDNGKIELDLMYKRIERNILK